MIINKFRKTAIKVTAITSLMAATVIPVTGETIEYEVQSNDNLSTIAEEYCGSQSFAESIAITNGIDNPDLLLVGQILTFDPETIELQFLTKEQESVATVASSNETSNTSSITGEVPVSSASTYEGTSSDAKEWIAQKESGGDYNAVNGQYIGRYQLTSSYLNGDYSAANQEATADAYVSQRYGSWEAAREFWIANGWY